MFKKTTLKNGLRILTIPYNDTKAMAVFVLVGTGSKYETKTQSGISHFLEHMFFKGTKKRPTPLEIMETIDRVGGMFNAFTGEDYTGYFVKVESEHGDLAIDIVADIFLNSLLPEKEIEKEKGVVIEEYNIYHDNPMRRADTLWKQLLYGDQPAGWDIVGTKETILGLKRQDLLAYTKNQYVPSNTVVCVAGNMNQQKVIAQATRLFGGMKDAAFKQKPNVVERQTKPEVLCEFKETDQTRIILGVRGYDLFHPMRYAQEVLATILGGMASSRLFHEVREKLGLAYDIRTASETDPDAGFLETSAGVPHKSCDLAIQTILKEYKKIAAIKVLPKELQKAKDHLKGTTALSLEPSEVKATFYGMQELLEKHSITPEQLHAKIKAVTAAQVQKVAQALFVPQNLNLVVVGPFKDEALFEKLLIL